MDKRAKAEVMSDISVLSASFAPRVKLNSKEVLCHRHRKMLGQGMIEPGVPVVVEALESRVGIKQLVLGVGSPK